MAVTATFTEFDSYKLTGVIVTDRELGHGSYATVLELEYMRLKCAGKKIHEVLLRQGGGSYTVRRFEEECHLLSQVRHPNIVQFLGVYFQHGVPAPILVMEFLPTNLTSCIEQYGILPKEISYSILHDVALGLCYLHSQTPFTIHRDLSANNVLLTPNMTAKISDLGVARILNLNPLQVSRMTGTPGTPTYMPPEVMIANPKYDTSIDEFSYGILMIHIFSGRWPEPQVGPTKVKGGHLVPVTEAERREVFLQAIGNEHHLMDLILRCINNDPKHRAHASEIVERLTAMTLQFPASFANRLETLRQVECLKEEKRVIREEGEVENQRKDQQILDLRKEAEEKEQEIVRISLACSTEVEQLKLRIRDLNAQNQLLAATKEAHVTELKTKAAVYEAYVENVLQISKQFETQQENDRKKLETEITRERKEFERLTNANRQLQAEISQSMTDTNSLKQKVSMLELEKLQTFATIKKIESELKVMTATLEEKEAIISGMSKQLRRATQHLSSKEQVVQLGITWKQCGDLPTNLNAGKTIVIDGQVYCGGGWIGDNENEYIVYGYDQLQDTWNTLPPLPVKYFGLGQVNGKLVAVGGRKKSDGGQTNDVYTYDEQLEKWKPTLPPMPTARSSPGVLSFKSALAVAGGETSFAVHTDVVEIFKADKSQWYSTDPLPTVCSDLSLNVLGNACYALGGHKFSHLNQVFCASIKELLRNAGKTTHKGSSTDTQSAWKILVNTRNYEPAATVLGDYLFAIGGEEISEGGAVTKEVYMFSSSTNSWIYISDLPEPRSDTAVAALSSTEMLVIGGVTNDSTANSVYKGTLHINL